MQACQHGTEKEFRLGKRQINILSETLAGVPVLDTDSAGHLSRMDTAEQLKAYRYTDTFAGSGVTNNTRPAVVRELLSRPARKTNYINGLASGDLIALVDQVTQACCFRKTALVFRLVFGGTERASLRALSYPLPTLQVMLGIREALGMAAYLQVVFVNNIASRLNGLNKAMLEYESTNISLGIRYIAEQLGLADQVGFFDDSTVNFKEIVQVADTFRREAAPEFFDLFIRKGICSRYVATSQYVAAHYVLHDMPDTRLRHLSGWEPPNRVVTVDFGCMQERYFRAARRCLGFALGAGPQIPQIYTRHHIPPYYLARGGDISLGDFLDGHKQRTALSPAAIPDLALLQRVVDVDRLREGTRARWRSLTKAPLGT